MQAESGGESPWLRQNHTDIIVRINGESSHHQRNKVRGGRKVTSREAPFLGLVVFMLACSKFFGVAFSFSFITLLFENYTRGTIVNGRKKNREATLCQPVRDTSKNEKKQGSKKKVEAKRTRAKRLKKKKTPRRGYAYNRDR